MKNYVDSAGLQEYTNKLIPKLKTIFPGAPLVAATAAAMTDHAKVYVYTGSETGYTAGNWYYWDGTAWASGGVYNSTALQTDTTLSIAGMAADAKVTGDDITDLKNAFNNSVFIPGMNMYDTSVLSGNNTAATNNNDGTFTIGTGDYGRSYFGDAVTLKPGTYLLYGVPDGVAFLTTSVDSSSWGNRVIANSTEDPIYYIAENEITLYLGFRMASVPASSFTIKPYLYKATPLEIDLINRATKEENAYNGRIISVNNNYLNKDDLSTGGFINPQTGVYTAFEGYKYGYIPIQGVGAYKLYQSVSAFGTRRLYIPLFNASLSILYWDYE